MRDPMSTSHSLWEIASDGSHLHPLLLGWSDTCCGNWTPDGNYFVFQSTRNTAGSNIWAIREKRSLFRKASREPVQLTPGLLNFWAPVPSRDGRKLFAVGGVQRGEVLRYDLRRREFVPYLAGISADGLAFSLDGGWVAYVAFPEGTLWRSRVDGSERLQLTFLPMRTALPRWSPDGRVIALMAKGPEKPWKVHLVLAAGGSLQELTQRGLNEADPGWSADGNTIVFGDTPWVAGEASGPTRIYQFDLRTRQLSALPGSEGLFSPRCSPDGRYIAALTDIEDKLMLFEFATRKWTELARIDEFGYPSWSRDGRFIYFDGTLENDVALFRLRLTDKKLERLVGLKEVRRAWEPLGPWSGLAADDSPLVLRDIGTQEIYALDWQAP